MRNTFNKMMGRTRFVVCRIFLHLSGSEVAPILGVLNSAAREAVNVDGDLDVVGEGLVQICQTLLQHDDYWLSAANEGEVFWNEGEAGDYVEELFTDSGQRYLSQIDFDSDIEDEPRGAIATRNVIVMMTVAYKGEESDLEADLSNIEALQYALKALINLHYKHNLEAVSIHFSPAQFGDELTNDQLLMHYPELIPL